MKQAEAIRIACAGLVLKEVVLAVEVEEGGEGAGEVEMPVGEGAMGTVAVVASWEAWLVAVQMA